MEGLFAKDLKMLFTLRVMVSRHEHVLKSILYKSLNLSYSCVKMSKCQFSHVKVQLSAARSNFESRFRCGAAELQSSKQDWGFHLVL